MQASNRRDTNRTSAEGIKKKQNKPKAVLTKKPSLPRSLHVESKVKTPNSCFKCNCFIFKPQNIIKALKISYWILLSESMIPFVLGIIGLGYDGSEWYGRVPKVQRVVFPIYLSLSIIQAIICSWQISKIYSIQINQRIPVIILLIFSAAYIILAVVGQSKFDAIYQDKDDPIACNNNFDQLFNPSLKDDFLVAKQNFCVLSQKCKCIIDNPSLFSQTLLSTLYYASTGEGVQNVLACPNVFANLFSSSGPKIIENLEQKFNCSGLCEPEPIFYFSDINRGPPKSTKSCFSIVIDELDIVKQIISLPILIIAGIMIVLLFIVALAARQYFRDPECLVLRMESFQRQLSDRQSNIQHQQSLIHPTFNGANGQHNINNSNLIVQNNSSIIQINGHYKNEDHHDLSDLHNNSHMQFQHKDKITQSILINNNQNESRQSPINQNNSGLQKKVTILTPSMKESPNHNENAFFYRDDPTIDVDSTKFQPKGKIQFIKIETESLNAAEKQL